MRRIQVLTLFLLVGLTTLPPLLSDGHGKYKVVHGWPQLPESFALGQAAGVEVDSHNHVWVFHRGQRPVMCFDGASGKILQSWGDGVFGSAHGLTVDDDDNVWLADNGTHLVQKFSHDGAPLMTLGTKGMPGQDGNHFNRPTDVAIAPNGDIYVTDGYGNSRVAKFDKNGRFLLEWGQKGDGNSEFQTPHGIALDDRGRVYVADRENVRMQIFDSNGKFLKQWKNELLGRPWGVDFSNDGFLFVADGGDLSTEPPVRNRVVKLDVEGNVLAKFGSFGSYNGQFYWAHDVAVAPDGAVYVVDVNAGMRVQKFVTQ